MALYTFEEIFRDPLGLHERPADAITEITQINPREVFLTHKNETVNAKSIYEVLSLSILQNSRISISIQVSENYLDCSSLLKEALRDERLTQNFRDYIERARQIRGLEEKTLQHSV